MYGDCTSVVVHHILFLTECSILKLFVDKRNQERNKFAGKFSIIGRIFSNIFKESTKTLR